MPSACVGEGDAGAQRRRQHRLGRSTFDELLIGQDVDARHGLLDRVGRPLCQVSARRGNALNHLRSHRAEQRAGRAVRTRRVPGPRGLRRPGRVRRAEAAGGRARGRVAAERAAHDLHHRRAGAVEQRGVPRRAAARMWCFFEEEAFGDDGQLRQAKELSINKIGHAMHDLDPVFERVQLHARSWPRSPTTSASHDALVAAEHVHLQAAAASAARSAATRTRRSSTPIRSRSPGSGSRSRTPRSRTAACGRRPAVTARRCARCSSAARRLRRRRHRVRGARRRRRCPRRPTTWCRSRCRPARSCCSTACCPTGATSTARRAAATRTRVHCISAAADYPAWNWLQRPADMPLRTPRSERRDQLGTVTR